MTNGADKITELRVALEVAQKIVGNVRESLPNMPDPDALMEDECAEVPITWRQWMQINMFLSYAEKELTRPPN